MQDWELKLRPANRPRPWMQDMLCAALLLCVTVLLMPSYGPTWSWMLHPGPENQVEQMEYLANVVGQVASSYLLAAMAMALVLRAGGIDLSVWAVAGLGGVVAAWLIRAGVNPAWGLAGGAGAGLVVGACNAVLVLRLRLPAVLVTLAMALVVVGVMHLGGIATVEVDQKAFDGWSYWPTPPLLVGRMLIVLGAYAMVMMGLMNVPVMDQRGQRPARLSLGLALVLAGLVAGLSGGIWLMDRSTAPLPLRPIGDLRVIVAPLLAGAVLLGGSGRTLVTLMLLPLAMLAATAWRQEVLDLTAWGYNFQLVLLGAMVVVTHLAFSALTMRGGGNRTLAGGASALCAAGVLTVTSSSAGAGRLRMILMAAGLGAWLIGAVLLGASRLRRRPAVAAPSAAI